MHDAYLDQEREKLATAKLDTLSNPTGLKPIRYDARVLAKETKEA
jgi:hypothetical protein